MEKSLNGHLFLGRPKMIARWSTGVLWLSAMTGAAPDADAASLTFTDVTAAAGLQGNAVESWGAAWGDLNKDGYPDLFTSNHRVAGRLMRNNGNGTFTNVTVAADPGKALRNPRDSHAGIWTDFDNDGDQDLTLAVGPLESYLLVNTNGVLRDERALRGLTIDFRSESRMPVYFDLNHDGLLDVKLTNWLEPATQDTFFRQKADHTFTKVVGSNGLRCVNSDWGQLADVNGSGPLELLCGDRNGFPAATYDLATGSGVTLPLAKVADGIDGISGDFDGDLQPDLVIIRGIVRPNEAVRVNSNRLETHLKVNPKHQYTLTLQAPGSFMTDINANNWDVMQSAGALNKVYIGSAGYHPASGTLNLSSSDPANQGVPSPSGRDGLFLGYNVGTGQWQFTAASATLTSDGYFVIDSDQAIGSFSLSGLEAAAGAMTPVLLRGTSGGAMEDVTDTSGLSQVRCVSGVAGDFDNDMDQDLYMTCRGGAENLADILWENLGDGTFQQSGVTGAEGRIGPAVSSGAGTGDSVVTADYDVDGFLDLFVTNGLNLRPKGFGGDNQLFHNLGNSNSWLEIDLVGASSGRDGVGAKVLVTAGGITQYREQNGGYHRWSQNHTRVHVGLGSNDRADVTVRWPSGTVDTFPNVAADDLYIITEGQGIAPR